MQSSEANQPTLYSSLPGTVAHPGGGGRRTILVTYPTSSKKDATKVLLKASSPDMSFPSAASLRTLLKPAEMSLAWFLDNQAESQQPLLHPTARHGLCKNTF